MSKSYLVLIIVLVVVVLGVGTFAFYRSQATPTAVTPTPSVQPTPVVPSPSPTLPNKINLVVSVPQNLQTVSSSSLTVTGTTVSNADVSVNDKDLKADAKGNFKTVVTLDEGENIIVVTAADEAGNFSETELTVTYAPVQ